MQSFGGLINTPNIDALAETFDIGRDSGTQVSDLYTGIFKFNGELDRVIFTVSDESQVPSRELPAMYY